MDLVKDEKLPGNNVHASKKNSLSAESGKIEPVFSRFFRKGSIMIIDVKHIMAFQT